MRGSNEPQPKYQPKASAKAKKQRRALPVCSGASRAILGAARSDANRFVTVRKITARTRMPTATSAPPRLVEMIGQAAMMAAQNSSTMMRVEALPAGALQRPPKAEAHRPEQIEVLRGIRRDRHTARIGLASRIHQRLHQKQQFAGTARALDNAFQAQQRAIEAKQPEQLPQPTRQQPRWPADRFHRRCERRAPLAGVMPSSQSRTAQNEPASPRYIQKVNQVRWLSRLCGSQARQRWYSNSRVSGL